MVMWNEDTARHWARSLLAGIVGGVFALVANPVMAGEVEHSMDCQGMHGQAEPSHANQGEPLGRDVFGALGAMKDRLESDPKTDWAVVDLDRFREHLVDMNEVVLHSTVTSRAVPGGFESTVSGTGRTAVAIQSMVPAHVQMIDGADGLSAKMRIVESSLDSAQLQVTVSTTRAGDVDRLRALGFFGFLTAGDHHEMHHWAMATGRHH